MQDHSAQWKEWLAEYGSRLLLFARQQTRSEADAEDVLQSALVKTWKTHRGAPDEKVVSLAYTNIRRCAIDLARSIDRRRLREDQSLRENFEQISWFSPSRGRHFPRFAGRNGEDPGKISRGDYSEDLG